jgi:hypothetical protein
MYTENGLQIDLHGVREIIERADVFTAAFHLFPERLLIDTRFDEDDPGGPSGMPMVAIVDPVATVQERFFWLGQHRPSLGMPGDFMFFLWPHSIGYLRDSGVWDAVRERIVASGFTGAGATCDDAITDLLERERRATSQAITGGEYQTIWSARDF